MKSSQPPIQRDPQKVQNLAAQGRRYKGTGWSPGTLMTSESGESQRYLVGPRGEFRRAKLQPKNDGNFDIAVEYNHFQLSGRQKRKFRKCMRARMKKNAE